MSQPRPARHARRTPRRRWRAALVAVLSVGLLAPVGALPAAADVPTSDPFPAAAGWVAQTLDAEADPSLTLLADAIIAFVASGSAGGATDAAADALAADAASAGTNAGTLAKVVLAASAAGRDPADLGGFDAEAALRGTMAEDGSFGGGQRYVQSLAILALATTDGGVPAEAVGFLAAGACADDGGFNFAGSCPGDVDVTAVAVQALLAGGADTDAAVDFLLDAQDPTTGAFPAFDGSPSANSSGLAAQALRAVGETAAADAAAAFVASLQKGCDAPAAERGAIAAYPDADGNLWFATTQGVLAAAPALHQLDGSTADAATAFLECYDGAFCPTGRGVSVVVDFTTLDPDRLPQVVCVRDAATDASALDVLAAAGFDTRTQDFGGDLGEALCAIDGLPDLPEGECFDPSYDYWAFWTAERGGDWTSPDQGAGSVTPADGTVIGFSWGSYPADPPGDARAALAPAPEPPYDRGIEAACPGTYPARFRDTAGNRHEAAIRCLAAAGITTGTADPTRFDPRGDLTRAQLASLLARAYDTATGRRLPAGPDAFPDDDGSVHERNIDALAAAGVIRGVGDGQRFAPNATVTRAQMASLLARFLDLLDDGRLDGSLPAATDRDVFRDDDGSVHEPNVDRLAVVGIVQGRNDGTFGPQVDVTRDQVATFVARSLDLAVTEGFAAPIR